MKKPKPCITLCYIITQVILAFLLVLAYDLLEDRRTDDDSARFKFYWIFWILNLNQSQFFAKHSNQSVRFSNRSQMTSKCGKNVSDTLGCASCATFFFLPHFDVICDLLGSLSMQRFWATDGSQMWTFRKPGQWSLSDFQTERIY